MTLPELIEDIELQFSECPCGDCLAKIDYDPEPPYGRSNNGELLFPDARPIYFYCAIKDETLNTDEMKGKQCDIKKHRKGNSMTDKVQKIREEIEKRYEYWREKESNAHSIESEIRMSECKHLLLMLNSLQKEPVSEYLNTESMIESYKQRLISQANGMKNNPLIDMCLASYKHGINETLDTLKLSNVQRTVKDWKEEHVCVKNKLNALSDGKQHRGWIDDAMALEMGEELAKEVEDYIDVNGFDGLDSIEEVKSIACHFVNWQKTKDESTTKDLGDYINELSKQFPEVSFAKLSRIAVRVAKWQRSQLMRNAIEAVISDDTTICNAVEVMKLREMFKGQKVKVIVIKED